MYVYDSQSFFLRFICLREREKESELDRENEEGKCRGRGRENLKQTSPRSAEPHAGLDLTTLRSDMS